ncbi:MAG TPA: hypothetical protein VFQ50_02145 [Flavobacterium sp.]|nr:hypothetical protein [Flavobacterium sp.]
MKNRVTISGYGLGFLILFSILSQSLHTFRHLAEHMSEKHCDHKYAAENQFSHSHNDNDRCETCDYIFSAAALAIPQSFSVSTAAVIPTYIYGLAPAHISFFSGSQFFHRGPPVFIV